jgi:hypothetical protein
MRDERGFLVRCLLFLLLLSTFLVGGIVLWDSCGYCCVMGFLWVLLFYGFLFSFSFRLVTHKT